MSEKQKCLGCDKPLRVQWTDTHGIGACIDCALPYRIYHYEGEGENARRVEKAPECPIYPEWVEVGRRYHQETGGRMFPGEFSFMGVRSGDRTYCGSTLADMRAWDDWLKAHEAELPKKREAEAAA